MRSVQTALRTDAISIVGQTASCINALDALWASQLPEDREPPQTVRLFLGDALLCWIETEFWPQCGGPPPYHDTYTFSFYSRDSDAAQVRHAILEALSMCGARVAATRAAQDHMPKPMAWWRRLWPGGR